MRRVSVVIPSFGHGRFIAEAIRSVAAQTRPVVDLVIVDDGSSDGSPEVIRRTLAEIELPNARFIEQENQGAYRALERGIREASGDLIAVLNSDDRFHRERIDRMLREVPERGDFLAFSAVNLIDATGDVCDAESAPVKGYRHALYEATRCPTVGFALLRNNIAVTSGNLLFTRSLYEKIGGFQPYRIAHDWDFLLQALIHVEPILVADRLLDYRTHGGNTRLHIDAETVNEEGKGILRRYLARCAEERPDNPLAPCSQNWPVYFDVFVSRYHSWFGQGPLRDWIPAPSASARRGAWRSWADVVDFDRVDDCDYLVDGGLDATERAALAVIRDVLLEAAHPLADEEGAGSETLRDVYERSARRIPHIRRRPWASSLDRKLAKPSPRASSKAPRRIQVRRALRFRHGSPRGALYEFARGLQIRWRIYRSGLFDFTYYRDQCRARGIRILDPVGHYLRRGADLGLDPHPWFQTRYYLLRNPDVAGQDNPLVHYLRHGDEEGRCPHPLFDPSWYRAANPDVAIARVHALSHFVRHGAAEGRSGHPRFDVNHYVAELGAPPPGNSWAHFVAEGRQLGIGGNRREALRLRLEAADAAAGTGGPLCSRGRDADLRRRVRMSGLFDADYYQAAWGTTIDEFGDAARHFLERGAIEGVAFCPLERLKSRLEELQSGLEGLRRPELAYLRSVEAPPAVAPDHRVTLYVNRKGNTFFREMADLLAAGFRAVGAESQILDETDPRLPVVGPRDHAIVVAPHEFFLLGEGPERLSRRFLERSSLWLAEQPGSEFFAMCLWFARFARRVLDLNPLSALAWGELGIPARALPLGFIADLPEFADRLDIESESVRAAQPPEVRAPVSVDAPLADRPLDIFFNGVLTHHRERFFARNAWFFAGLRCALYMPTPRVPISVGLASALSARDATALSQRSRILLNIHREDTPYFEWHRVVVRGFWQKAVVVTEPTLRVPGFEPGEHYIACTLEEMPRRIEWLLHTDDGRSTAEKVRTRAFETLRARYPLTALSAAFLAHDSTGEGVA